MTEPLRRRTFITRALLGGAGLSLGGTLLYLSGVGRSRPLPGQALETDPEGICDLPPGFRYTVISAQGETMTDGHIVPDYHDGMACFEGPAGELILVRNHEIPTFFPADPTSPAPEHAYDPASSGGTTTIWLGEDMRVLRHHLSLTGTIRNCSGGKTPWNTWISCEEAANGGWMMGKRHGYCFEVDPQAPLRVAEPLRAMGRFNHEAVAVDPRSGIVYLTEDDVGGCFYRFIPDTPGRLAAGGRLQALRLGEGEARHTTDEAPLLGEALPCTWVAVDEPDPETNTVRRQAQAKGAAVFVRGEGIIADKDGIYFACTSGGADGVGQIFRYRAAPKDRPSDPGGTIELVFEATRGGLLEKPDNITLSPWGDLIVCEDNGLQKQCLVGLTPGGSLYTIAAQGRSEWSGACFSPDGETLFANIHRDPAMTVAIQGPWQSLRSSAG